jgi:D-beta-D-heptose 7-phosphate kinase/D-beta-D-heptose 1-phosphate adenosyltransferase
MTRERAGEIMLAMRGRRVVILGDLMLDRYVWGDVSRISAEAPVPVVEATRQSWRLGGAANVAANVASLEGAAILVGVVGRDADGELLCEGMVERGLDVAGVVTLAGRPTTVKTRILARSQQVVRLDMEARGPLDGDEAAAVEDKLRSLVAGAHALVVSDYGKGVVVPRILEVAIGLAQASDVPVAVDPKESHFDLYRGVTTITPNLLEAANAVGHRLDSDEAVYLAGHELRSRLDARSVLITRGERGMTLFEEEGATHLAAVAEEVFDVTGAGDTVVGVVALAVAAGASLVEAAELSNHAASLVIREVGTAVVTPEELLATFPEKR